MNPHTRAVPTRSDPSNPLQRAGIRQTGSFGSAGSKRTGGRTPPAYQQSNNNNGNNSNNGSGMHYRECVCGRGMKCIGMTQAFRMLGDPRCHYVELPRFRVNPPAYKYVFRNNLRQAYLRHLAETSDECSPEAFDDNNNDNKRRYVALHHFHPHVVKTFYENPLTSARRHKVPISITEYEMKALGIERRPEDRILSMNGKPTGGYYFVPHYRFEDAHEDLKELIRQQRQLQMEARDRLQTEKEERARRRRERRQRKERERQEQLRKQQVRQMRLPPPPGDHATRSKRIPSKIQLASPAASVKSKISTSSLAAVSDVPPPQSEEQDPFADIIARSSRDSGSFDLFDENDRDGKNEPGAFTDPPCRQEEPPTADIASSDIQPPKQSCDSPSIQQVQRSDDHDDDEEQQQRQQQAALEPTEPQHSVAAVAAHDARSVQSDDDLYVDDEDGVGDDRMPQLEDRPVEVITEHAPSANPLHRKRAPSVNSDVDDSDGDFNKLWNDDEQFSPASKRSIVVPGQQTTDDLEASEAQPEKDDAHDESPTVDTTASATTSDEPPVMDDIDILKDLEETKSTIQEAQQDLSAASSPSPRKSGHRRDSSNLRNSLVYEWEERAREEAMQTEIGETPACRVMPADQGTSDAAGEKNDNLTVDDTVNEDHPFDRPADDEHEEQDDKPQDIKERESSQPKRESVFAPRMSVISEGDESAKSASNQLSRFFQETVVRKASSVDSCDKASVTSQSQASMAGEDITLTHQMPGTDPTLRIQVHNDLIAWESKRRSEAMASLDYTSGEWKAAKDILLDGVEEVRIAERLVLGTARAGMIFSNSMTLIYEDKFLDNQGNTVTNSFVQNRLMQKRSSQEYSIDAREGKVDGQRQSALLDAVIESQSYILKQFRDNSIHMEDEILPHVEELRMEMEAKTRDLESAGARILAEMKRSEMEINKIWDVFDGMVTGDLMEYSVHGSLHGSAHGASVHGSSHFGGSVHGFLTPRSDGDSALGGISSNSPIVRGALRQSNVIEDGWLIETYYRAAVAYQKALFEHCENEMRSLYGEIAELQHKIRSRLQESMLAFVPRQRRLFLGLPEHFKGILEDLVGLRIDEESLEAMIEGSVKERSHTHLKSSYMHKSSIMNRSRLADNGQQEQKKIEDVQTLFGSPLDSLMVKNTQVVELKPSVLGTLVNANWKAGLAIVTSSGLLHVLEVPNLLSSTVSAEEAFKALCPDDRLESYEDWSQTRRDVIKSLTPFVTLDLCRCSMTVRTTRKRQVEIIEESTGGSSLPGSRFLRGAGHGQRGKKCVLRLTSAESATDWVATLQETKKGLGKSDVK